MKSMTGYGYKERLSEDYSLTLEIKSYNNRYLEIFVNVPSFLSPLEQQIRARVNEVCTRGKVEVYLRVRELCSDQTVTVDMQAAKAYQQALTQLGAELCGGEKPSLNHFLALEGVLKLERTKSADDWWQPVQELLEEALEDFLSSRQREGDATEAHILQELSSIEEYLTTVRALAAGIEENIKKNIRERFHELLGDSIDENRILTETAVLLMKYTISEEIARLGAHLQDFRRECASNPSPGKKLDFLCQEINREINTIGSKNQDLEGGRAVVSMKDKLENIREQLRNVE
jgi:uncharacterized protein (TIGR00255 family)